MSICKLCFKEIINHGFSSIFHKPSICFKCFLELEAIFSKNKMLGIEVISIFKYNDFFKSVLFQYKGCFDIEIKNIFLERYVHYLRYKYKGYIIIPAPSNEDEDEIRGFNHVIEAFELLKLPIQPIIKKKIKFKQSDLDKKEREKIKNKLLITNFEIIHNKKILIVDDIITTGSTIKAMIEMIKKYNPKDIKVLTIAKVCRKK